MTTFKTANTTYYKLEKLFTHNVGKCVRVDVSVGNIHLSHYYGIPSRFGNSKIMNTSYDTRSLKNILWKIRDGWFKVYIRKRKRVPIRDFRIINIVARHRKNRGKLVLNELYYSKQKIMRLLLLANRVRIRRIREAATGRLKRVLKRKFHLNKIPNLCFKILFDPRINFPKMMTLTKSLIHYVSGDNFIKSFCIKNMRFVYTRTKNIKDYLCNHLKFAKNFCNGTIYNCVCGAIGGDHKAMRGEELSGDQKYVLSMNASNIPWPENANISKYIYEAFIDFCIDLHNFMNEERVKKKDRKNTTRSLRHELFYAISLLDMDSFLTHMICDNIERIIDDCIDNNNYHRNNKHNWLSINMVKKVKVSLQGWVVMPLDKNSNCLLVA